MADDAELMPLCERLLESCYDPETKIYRGKTIDLLNCTGEDGNDMGDWVVIIQPVRVPEGKRVDFSHEVQ